MIFLIQPYDRSLWNILINALLEKNIRIHVGLCKIISGHFMQSEESCQTELRGYSRKMKEWVCEVFASFKTSMNERGSP